MTRTKARYAPTEKIAKELLVRAQLETKEFSALDISNTQYEKQIAAAMFRKLVKNGELVVTRTHGNTNFHVWSKYNVRDFIYQRALCMTEPFSAAMIGRSTYERRIAQELLRQLEKSKDIRMHHRIGHQNFYLWIND